MLIFTFILHSAHVRCYVLHRLFSTADFVRRRRRIRHEEGTTKEHTCVQLMITLITDDRLLFSSFLPTIDFDLLDQRFAQPEGWAKHPGDQETHDRWINENLCWSIAAYIKNLLRPLLSKIKYNLQPRKTILQTLTRQYIQIYCLFQRYGESLFSCTQHHYGLAVSFLRTLYWRIRMIYDLYSLFPLFWSLRLAILFLLPDRLEPLSHLPLPLSVPCVSLSCVSSLAFMVEGVIRLL